MSASLVGQTLGKYEIIALLGQGGMATVYKGYQQEVDRFVAVKVLPPHPGQSAEFVERFRLEARTVARLQHPHILPLYDYGSENDILYLVMAYVDGGSLSDRIRRGALSLSEAQHLLEQVADALDYAHRQNVIHRDIKPDNVLLDREGHALLGDFGIVKILEEGGTLRLTGTGGLVGTPAYMSPEQAQGLPVDNRSDIYSLGVVLYEMLSGKQPFEAETPMQVVLKHLTAPVPSISQLTQHLPPELDNVIGRALAKDPNQRYPSAKALYQDFSRVVKGEPPLAKAPDPTPEPPPVPVTASYTVGTPPAQPTLVATPAWNPLILLGGFAIIALLIVAVVALILNFNRPVTEGFPAATLIPITAFPSPISAVPNFGTVSYTTNQTPGDTVNVVVKGLTPPPQGQSYAVWLKNTLSGASLKLGNLRLDPLGNGQLSYSGSDMLPAFYNAVLITQESGEGDTPSGRVAYSGSVPDAVMAMLQETLISSPDGIPPLEATAVTPYDGGLETDEPTVNTSLLAGALEEASIGEKHSGLAADATSVGSLHTHAEHTINILNGTFIDYNGNGRGENPGHGYGIAYFIDRIQSKLDAIASAPTADHLIQGQAELIRVCLVNVRNWMAQVVNLETQMLNANDLDAVHPQLVEATQWATAMVSGVDLNQNGQVEPFEGECGLQQIGDFGISVGNISIFAGSLPQGD